MKNLSIVLLLAFAASKTVAQSKQPEYFATLTNNAISFPFGGTLGVIHQPLHLGFGLGMIVKHWNKSPQHQIYQTARFGLIYQQYVQTAVQLYSDFNYRFQLSTGFGVGANAGLGYVHSFNGVQQFKANAQGQYEKTGKLGRPNVMIPVGLNVGYAFTLKNDTQLRPFIEYQLWLQTPFAKEYIPILPNSALHIGIAISKSAKTE